MPKNDVTKLSKMSSTSAKIMYVKVGTKTIVKNILASKKITFR
jgi:hypothetical protein